MKKISEEVYQEIRTWIYRNARPLDLALWRYWFEQGEDRAVLEALDFYQNEDGGFGHGIEPDLWNPDSTPYATLTAAGILEEAELLKKDRAENSLIWGIFRYFENTLSGNGWHFSVPSNDNFPHAPWWSYSEEMNRVQDMGLTAGICAFLLRYCGQGERLYQSTWKHAENILENLETRNDLGEMGAGSLWKLVQVLDQTKDGNKLISDRIRRKVWEAVNQSIERDPAKWKYYTVRPSQYIVSPESPLYAVNEDIVEAELDYLVDMRQTGGVWDITWSWFWGAPGQRDIYSKEFAVSENWWKAQKAVMNLRFLKNFGRA